MVLDFKKMFDRVRQRRNVYLCFLFYIGFAQ